MRGKGNVYLNIISLSRSFISEILISDSLCWQTVPPRRRMTALALTSVFKQALRPAAATKNSTPNIEILHQARPKSRPQGIPRDARRHASPRKKNASLREPRPAVSGSSDNSAGVERSETPRPGASHATRPTASGSRDAPPQCPAATIPPTQKIPRGKKTAKWPKFFGRTQLWRKKGRAFYAAFR